MTESTTPEGTMKASRAQMTISRRVMRSTGRGSIRRGSGSMSALRALVLGLLALAVVPAVLGEEAGHDHGAPASAPSPKPAPAPQAVSESMHPGRKVSFQSGDQTVSAYLAVPKTKGPHPAVVVVHEWWGLNDQIRGVADDLASKGYVALTPDLYEGRATSDPSVAQELMRALSETKAVANLVAAHAYLRTRQEVGDKPIGSIGFCMGGRLSLLLAIAEPKLRACVVCYGRPETDPARLAALRAPMLGIYGGADKGIPQEMVDAFKKSMESAGKTLEVHVYPDAGHGFMNPNNPSHIPKDAKEAWKVIQAFLAKNLTAAGH